eukprot:Nk52_evm14s243 gene=Nk52_evmTU14s243
MDASRIEQLLAVNAADKETQEARVAAMHGKKIVFITCPYSTVNMGYQRARDMGVEVWALGNADTQFKKDFLAAHDSHKFIDADILTDDAKACKNALDAIKATGVEFDGVFTMHEIAVPLMCELTDALNFHGNSLKAAENARNKALAREICEKNGLNSPSYAYIRSPQDIEAACEKVGFPMVVKPSSGAGSFGVVRADKVEDVAKTYQEIVDEMNKQKLLNWNPGCEEVTIMVEQYLDGPEYDVDCLFWEGECKFISVSDNWPTHEPYFLETGSNCPSTTSEDKQAELKKYVIDVVKALGFKQGAFHVECKYCSNGPQLIEVNPRMGGGSVHEFNLDVYGVSLYDNFLLAAAGIPINPPRAEKPLVCTGDYSLNAPITGTLKCAQFLKHLEGHKSVVWARALKKEGEFVKGVDQGLPDWIGEIRVNADSLEEVVETLNEIVEEIKFDIVPEADEKTAQKVESITEETAQIDITVG